MRMRNWELWFGKPRSMHTHRIRPKKLSSVTSGGLWQPVVSPEFDRSWSKYSKFCAQDRKVGSGSTLGFQGSTSWIKSVEGSFFFHTFRTVERYTDELTQEIKEIRPWTVNILSLHDTWKHNFFLPLFFLITRCFQWLTPGWARFILYSAYALPFSSGFLLD